MFARRGPVLALPNPPLPGEDVRSPRSGVGRSQILPVQGRGTAGEAGGGGVSNLGGRAQIREVVYPSTTRYAGGPPPPPGEDFRSPHNVPMTREDDSDAREG